MVLSFAWRTGTAARSSGDEQRHFPRGEGFGLDLAFSFCWSNDRRHTAASWRLEQASVPRARALTRRSLQISGALGVLRAWATATPARPLRGSATAGAA